MTHTNTLIDRLVQALGKEGVIVADAIEPRYRKDWSGVPPGEPIALLRPRSTEEVSAALAICHEFNTPVVAQGGLTGLAGAAVPAAGQIALTLERMSGVEEVDCAAATLTALAGTPIQVVQEAARDQGFLFALDWGARGSAVVGGGLSTNAGGNRVIRYGMAREHVLGLEVVLADGTVLPMLNKMQKNNSGYDLKQLFIGSEGTLGIITRAVLRLQPQSAAPCTALCSVAGFDAAVKLLRLAQRRLVGAVGAFEAMWPDYYRAATSYGKVRAPLGEAPFYVLTDMVTADPGVDGERFQAMLEEAMAAIAIVARTDAFYLSRNPNNAFWSVDGAHVGYHGLNSMHTTSPMDLAVTSTRHMILSQTGAYEGKVTPFSAQWGSAQNHHGSGSTSRITIYEAEDIARTGGHAAQILSKAFPGTHIELIY